MDLIPSPLPSMKIQIMGGKIRKPGVRIQAPEGQKFVCPFSLHFQILRTKLHIFVFNHFSISCFTNQISISTNVFKLVKHKDMQFCMENLKMKRKKANFFRPPGAGIRTPDFQ